MGTPIPNLDNVPTTFADPVAIGKNGFAVYGNDESLPVEFELRAVAYGKDHPKHGEYIEKEFIKISYPGTKDILCREVYEKDKMRWPRQYAMFQQHGTSKAQGTSLEEWGQLSAIEVATLKGQNIQTLEQLAGTPDSALRQIKLPDIRSVQTKAKEYLAKIDRSIPFKALREENDKLRMEMDMLRAEMKEMISGAVETKVAEVEEKKKKTPMRPMTLGEKLAAGL